MDIDIGIDIDSASGVRFILSLDKSSVNKTAAGADAIVTATISRYVLGETTVRLYVSGAKEAVAENFGFGPNFTGQASGACSAWVNTAFETNYTTVTFGALDESKDVTLTVVNNPVVELDRTVSVVVKNSTGATTLSNAQTYTIVDDNRDFIIDITNPYFDHLGNDNGLEAAYPSDNLDQYALDNGFASNNAANMMSLTWTLYTDTKKKAVFYYPNGTYGFAYTNANPPTGSVYLLGNQTHVGESKTGTIIRRWTGAQARAYGSERIWLTYAPAQAADHEPIGIKTLTFHGDNLPVSCVMTFTGQPSAGQAITFGMRNTANALPAAGDRTFTWDTDMAIGADLAASVANLKAELELHGYVCTIADPAHTNVTAIAYHPTYWRYGTSTDYVENCSNMTWERNEHANCLYIGAVVSNTGRTVVRAEQIKATANPAGDAVSAGGNTDFSLYDITDDGTGEEYFARGLLAFGGGYSKYRLKGFVGDYFHTEIDTVGYGSSQKTESVITDVTGNTVFLVNYDATGTLDASYITAAERWNYYGAEDDTTGGTVFSNCDLTQIDNTYLVRNVGQNLIFNDCHFRIHDEASSANTGTFFVNLSPLGETNQLITLNRCHFYPGNSSLATKRVLSISTAGDWDTMNNKIKFVDCVEHASDSGANFYVSLNQNSNIGGIYEYEDHTFVCTYLMRLSSSLAGTNWKIILNGGTYTGISKFGYIYNCGAAGNKLLMSNVSITKAQNVIEWFTQQCTAIEADTVTGDAGVMRTITGGTANPPNIITHGPGFINGATKYDKLIALDLTECKPDAQSNAATWNAI